RAKTGVRNRIVRVIHHRSMIETPNQMIDEIRLQRRVTTKGFTSAEAASISIKEAKRARSIPCRDSIMASGYIPVRYIDPSSTRAYLIEASAIRPAKSE